VVEALGDGKSSGAIGSNIARICIRCKESLDNLDVAVLGCIHQRCCPLSIGMVDNGTRYKESPNSLDVAQLGSHYQRCEPATPGMVDVGARFDEGLTTAR
jgi:hypothetical protein